MMKYRPLSSLLAVAVTIMPLASVAVAQGEAPPTILTPAEGQAEVAVTLAAGAVQRFRFVGVADRLIDVRLVTPDDAQDVDPFLTLSKEGGELVTDDDSGGYPNALIRLVLVEGGQYEIAASELIGRPGTVVLRYRLMPVPRVRNLDLPVSGQWLTAAIGDDAPFLYQPGSGYLQRFRQYRFAGGIDLATLRRNNQLLHIDMESETLDAVLELGFDTPFGYSTVARGDDFDCTSNARIVIDPAAIDPRFYSDRYDDDVPEWGRRIRLRASGLGQGTGGYRLRVAVVARDAPARSSNCEAMEAALTPAEQAEENAQFDAAVAAAQEAVERAAREARAE